MNLALNMAPNRYIYAVCDRPEVDRDTISGQNWWILKLLAQVVRKNKSSSFCYVGDGGGGGRQRRQNYAKRLPLAFRIKMSVLLFNGASTVKIISSGFRK